jgi:hypothetical protein
VCAQCGSRDLSTPAPRKPLWLVPTLWLVRVVPGVLLILLSLLLVVNFIQAVPEHPELFRPFLGAGLMLALLWYVYVHLPAPLQRLLKRKGSKGHKGGGSSHAGHS